MAQGWGQGGYGPPPAPGGYGQPPPSGHMHGGAPIVPHPHAGLVWTCRSCGFQGPPARTSKVSTGGWIVFFLSGATCVGLLVGWIALLTMKTHTTLCPACRTPAGTA